MVGTVANTGAGAPAAAAILAGLPVALAVALPPCWQVVQANQACRALAGGDPLGLPLAALIPGGDPAAMLEACRAERPLAGRAVPHRPRPDGPEGWWDYDLRPLPGEGGAPHAMVLTAREVTEEVRARQAAEAATAALSHRAEQMRLALGAARMFFWDWDIATGAVTWSEGLEEACGLPPGGFGGTVEAFRALMHPDDLPRVEAELARALDGQAPYDTEFRMRRPDGALRWVVARATVLRDPAGRPVRMIGIDLDVTERKAREEALRESEERLRLAQEAAGAGLWEYRPATGAAVLSPGYCALYGLEEAVAARLGLEGWLALLHPADRDRLRRATLEMARTGTLDEEFRIHRADTGELRWIHSRARVFDRCTGPVLIGINLDVTDRRQAHEALRESEALLRLAEETAGFGIWEFDAATCRLRWSAQQYRLHGLDPAHPAPGFAEWLAWVEEADRPALLQAAEDGFQGGHGRYQLVFRMRRPGDGALRSVLAFGRVLERDAEGRPLRMMGVNLDVTAQRELQLDLLRTEALLRAIGECSPDLIFAKDLDSRFLFANPPTLRIIGKPLDELLGRSEADWHHDPAQAAAIMANDRRILATGRAEVVEERFDAAGLGTRVFRSAKAPLRDQAGRIFGLVGVASDITDRKQVEVALRAALEERELLMREADHRIKNSLQLVASLLRIQARRAEEPAAAEPLRAAVARVLAIGEAHRALYSGRDFRTVDLSHMLADLVRLASGLAPAIALRCDLPQSLMLDAERAIPLGLLATELIINALRHAYPQGGPGTVRVAARPEPGGIMVTIADDGVGLPAGGAPQPGLGTSLIQALSRQIGAGVETRSLPGAGTTVTLRVPLRPVVAEAPEMAG